MTSTLPETREQRIFYVYALLREDNFTPFYIGKGKGGRWKSHIRGVKNPSSWREFIIAKMLQDGHEINSVKIVEHLTESEAFLVERKFITQLGRETNGGLLCNLTDGGDGLAGMKRTDSFRKRMSDLNKGNLHPMFGRKLSEEARAKISARHKGRKLTQEQIEVRRRNALGNTANSGRKFTDEHKRKIGDARRGKKLSEAHKLSISKTRKERYGCTT